MTDGDPDEDDQDQHRTDQTPMSHIPVQRADFLAQFGLIFKKNDFRSVLELCCVLGTFSNVLCDQGSIHAR